VKFKVYLLHFNQMLYALCLSILPLQDRSCSI